MTEYTVLLEYWSPPWIVMWDMPIKIKAWTATGAARKALRYARSNYRSYAGDVFQRYACRVTVSDETIMAPHLRKDGYYGVSEHHSKAVA